MARGVRQPLLAEGVRDTSAHRRIPEADDFADYPAAWYWLCSVRDLDRGPLTRRMLGGEFVAYRGLLLGFLLGRVTRRGVARAAGA